jgi:hypothetical protein
MKQQGSNGRSRRRTYFFLSYAHVPPDEELTPDSERDEPDYQVTVLFQHLRDAVERYARTDSGLDIGFYDPLLPPGSNWKALLAQELGAAEVFVPLYSSQYLTSSWSRTERASFGQRLAATGKEHAATHIQPVWWTPIRSYDQWPDDDRVRAEDLGADQPDYLENGLRALHLLAEYEDQYMAVVDRLARRIVQIAEGTPLGMTTVPALTSQRPSVMAGPDTPFVVAVLAAAGTQWRAFGSRTIPVAEYAANLAERFNLPATVVDLDSDGAPFESAPGLLLVDPGLASSEAGRARIAAAFDRIPEWVMTVVVADARRDRAGAFVDAVVGMLPKADPPRVQVALDAIEFVQVVENLVGPARRLYLERAKVYPPAGSTNDRPGRRQRNPEGDR